MGNQIIKQTLPEEPPLVNPVKRVTVMEDEGGELFEKAFDISLLRMRDLEENVIG